MKLDVPQSNRIRIDKGYSLGRIATEVETDKSAVSQWFNGKRGIGLENAQKLAELFGCTIGQLLGQELYTASSSLPADGKSTITAEHEIEEGEIRLKLVIELSGIPNTDMQSAKLSEIIAFLSKFLPNGKGIVIIGSSFAAATIGIKKTAANEMTINDPVLREQLADRGILDFAITETVRRIPNVMVSSPKPPTRDDEKRSLRKDIEKLNLIDLWEQKLITGKEFKEASAKLERGEMPPPGGYFPDRGR